MCGSRGRDLLESHSTLIQQRLQALSRHSVLPGYQKDEFLSWALSKLVENDYRILAGWEGRSSFSTYLTVVLVNLMRDYCLGRPEKRQIGEMIKEIPLLQETSEPTLPRTRRTRSDCLWAPVF